MMHDSAIDAALAVMADGFSLGGVCDDDRRCAERAIAAFLRAWEPENDIRRGYNGPTAIRIFRAVADELEGKA